MTATRFLLAGFLALAVSTGASAQVTPTPVPAPSSGQPAATSERPPLAGANSFTEAQARERIETHGYTGVTGLKKDDDSIWRGKATKNGAQVDVALDFRGNIVER